MELFWVIPLDRFGLGYGFVIWAGIPLFWAVAPVRALAEGEEG